MTKSPNPYISHPHKVDVYNITYEKWLKMDKWCHDKRMYYSTDYIGWDRIIDSFWTFRDSDDAALFKLTWL